MINVENVSFSYPNGTKALSNINLNIKDGEFVFVVGSSGAGKSTMLKLLTRELVADEGQVAVNNFNLMKLKNRKIPKYRRTIGTVFQDFRLIPSMTVFNNVAFALRVTNHSMKYIRSRVPYVLDLVELNNKEKKYPREISGGEQQRVAIARALASDPTLIIADEPTGNVDPGLSLQIVDLLMNINHYCKTTVLMITHQHDIVRHYGGRTISIENGEIEFDGILGGANEGE